MFVASHYHIIVRYVDITGGGRSTEEADGVQGNLKLWTGANEGTAHWLYLSNEHAMEPLIHSHVIIGIITYRANHHPSNRGLVCWNVKAL